MACIITIMLIDMYILVLVSWMLIICFVRSFKSTKKPMERSSKVLFYCSIFPPTLPPMDALKKMFQDRKSKACSFLRTILWIHAYSDSYYQGSTALITFVTDSYPTKYDTLSILLAMQAGGADIIELGVPFSDPVADGPTIQRTNSVN